MMAFITGMLFWTFLEYMLHRFLGHIPKKPSIYSRFFKEHSKHHHKKDYFAATIDKILTTVALAPLAFGGVYFLFDVTAASWFTVGFIGMYYAYELLHRRLHVKGPIHRYAAYMRAHHFYHHYEDETMNHGVSTPIWDIVFGTYRKPDIIHVPARYKMDWLPAQPSFTDPYGHQYQITK